jgi:uncharacterized protein (DUF924 family)
MSETSEDVLEFWFGVFPDAYRSDSTKVDMWFANGANYDQEIFLRFGAVYLQAISHELMHWLETPRGRLAHIIVLDQFSRHIHRGQAESFLQDRRAQEICLDGIAAGDDLKLHPAERSFFYLPLEHAETVERQNFSIEAFTRLCEDVPEEHRKTYGLTLEWAKKHHYVIERFGRFPELNEILERESSAEELAFIESGEYSFL